MYVRGILKKSLSDCFHILYVDWYRWEDSWEARWDRSDYLWVTQGPPNSQKFTFLYIVAHIWKTVGYFFPLLYICLLCDEVLLPWNFRSPGFDIRAPQDPPNMKKVLFVSYFGFKLKKFLSYCFLVSHVHRYGWEDSWKARLAQSDNWRPRQGPLNTPKYTFIFTFWPINEKLVFKLFPLIVHMSPLWWGLHLLTFWCPWYP